MTARTRSAHSERLYGILAAQRDEVRQVFAKYHAFDVKLFGSVARGEAGLASDIDLMVSIEAPDYEQVVSMLGMAEELSELLGTKVDVVARGVARGRVSETALADMVEV